MCFKHFQLENPVSSTCWDEQNSPVQNSDYFKQLISDLSILDLYALDSHLCMQKHMKFIPFCINHTPSAHLRLPKKKIFPGPSQLQKLNQFKQVLVSGKSMKNLKFSPFYTNFTQF